MSDKWERDEAVSFQQCVFADKFTEDEARDFLSPANTDNLLLWGLPGTGKTTIAKAIAQGRCSTAALTEDGLIFLNCKDKEVAKKLNSKWLLGWYNLAHFYSNCPVLIIDELDELSGMQQRELTAFIDWSNSDGLRSMILATTNVKVSDRIATSKVFSPALVSRFNTQLEVRPQAPSNFVPLVQSKLACAGLHVGRDKVLELITAQLPIKTTTVDFRPIQTAVNKTIRNANPPPKTKPPLRLV
ncbi:ATP-binding protein [Octadecabacter sp. CECT 8868]|uniref:ATP-binding protein n=1 Tax=Octadecabacter algicola TaxID=2909342 RepID=UPI001F2BB7C0|nr:ATP-binding protein [Octadecabacter algicola]MCF2904637.1 ATP-binding protein [Octadecabacter algicola]